MEAFNEKQFEAEYQRFILADHDVRLIIAFSSLYFFIKQKSL